jgi:hypothetical protein
MPARKLARRQTWFSAAALSLAFTAPCWAQSAQPQPQPLRLRATIDAVQAGHIDLTTRSGEKVTVTLPANTVVVAIVSIRLEDIKPGSFVGSAAVPQEDGTQRALEVHVFPESMRGTGEGHRPFDLQPQSTMTNGTVGAVTGSVGRTLKVTYQGGEKTIVVPENTPVVTYEPGSAAMLVPGAHVILMGTRAEDGQMSATRISVGKDGLVPPM